MFYKSFIPLHTQNFKSTECLIVHPELFWFLMRNKRNFYITYIYNLCNNARFAIFIYTLVIASGDSVIEYHPVYSTAADVLLVDDLYVYKTV
jgi:hypothetical protein